MPSYLGDIATWRALWPLAAGSLALASIACICFWTNGPAGFSFRSRLRLLRAGFVNGLAFATLGMTTGFITGTSREPAVHAVLPAVLSLFAGLAVFLVAKQASRRDLVGTAVLALSSALLVGTLWGAREREIGEMFRESEEYLVYKARTEANMQMQKAKLNHDVDLYLLEIEESAVQPGGVFEKSERVAAQKETIRANIRQEVEAYLQSLAEHGIQPGGLFERSQRVAAQKETIRADIRQEVESGHQPSRRAPQDLVE